jgi:hypothetical protein
VTSSGRTIALVACAARKQGRPTRAADLYVSDLFRKSRTYAERHAAAWFVLSAKHGLVEPTAEVEPYEMTLNAMTAVERGAWSARVLRQLEHVVKRGDTVIVLAGIRYREGIVQQLEELGAKVEVPMAGLRIGEQLAWLAHGSQDLLASPPEPVPLEGFYASIRRLVEKQGRVRLRDIVRRPDLPLRGLYFFFDPRERRGAGDALRVVRVGTHALKRGSRSTLRGRLRQHLGTRPGGGNHRGSVFRLHVGAALLHRAGLELPTWGVGGSTAPGVRLSEREYEQRVSRYIGELEVVTLEVLDEPGPASLRGYIERNAIALLASEGCRADPPSADWLGHASRRESVRASGLWNVRHVDDAVDGAFLAALEKLVSAM